MSPSRTRQAESSVDALAAAVRKLLRPLVRILLRYGVPYGAFAELAKGVYVDVASEDFRIEGRAQTVSRVSVITGVSRKEIRRLRLLEQPDDSAAAQRYNRAARVITGWAKDARFADRAGRPAPLPFEGASPSFTELVREYSGDVTPRAILDEFERVGAVDRAADGRLRLVARAYVPRTGEADKLQILGQDVSDLITCIEHNLQCDPEDAYFQRKVSYDNLPSEPQEDFNAMARKLAQRLLEKLDRAMAEEDRDSNTGVKGDGRKRVAVGIYYFEEDISEDN